jgi:AraC-like DNA-binding protein
MNVEVRPRTPGPTILGSLVRALLQTVAERGVDPAILSAESGIDPRALTTVGGRVPLRQATELWRRAVATTDDPALGLAAAERVQPASAHAVSLAWFASCSLREALRRLTRFHRVINAGISIRLLESRDRVELEVHQVVPGTIAPEAIDGFCAVTIRFCRMLLGKDYAAQAVELQRPDPDRPLDYERALGVVPRFHAERNALTFSTARLDELLPAGDPELASHLDAIAERELAHLNEPGLAARVQGCVEALLPTGRPTLDMVARLVDRSTRSLQRALQQEGTSFKELVEAGQRSQAMRYIRETDHPLSAIALAVGFSDQSNFNRAFRRWTGLSPGAWRNAGPAD